MVPVTTLSPEVRELIDARIDSVDALDVLLLLLADTSRWFGPAETARVVGVDVATAERALEQLRARGLVDRPPSTRLYRMASKPSASFVSLATLARVCADARAAVVEYVQRRSLDRLRVLATAYARGNSPRDP